MSLQGLTAEEIAEFERQMMDATPDDGSSIGNKSLREQLGWAEDRYFAVRAKLVENGELILGRGRGGSVRQAVIVHDLPPEGDDEINQTTAPTTEAFPTESSLYAPMLEVLRSRWVKDQPFEKVIVEDTSQGGRRADGTWARPDMTAVSATTYTYVPNKHFDVTTFEVKHHKGLNVTAIYEALAHRRAATRAYVLVYVPDDILDKLETPVLSDMLDEASRHGIGLIIAADPADFDTWDIREEASVFTPDPARMNNFIRTQLTEGTREEILRWFR